MTGPVSRIKNIKRILSPVVKLFLKRHILKNRALIHPESKYMHDFMHLLMKRRNARTQ
jgi:hypothetical protein